jgi:nucleoid-associated protein YgaU
VRALRAAAFGRHLAAAFGLLVAAAPGFAEEGETVVVEPGDSLAKIAERELGHAGLWPVLYRANRDRIKDPERVYPGQELTVPHPPPRASRPGAPSESEAPAREAP